MRIPLSAIRPDISQRNIDGDPDVFYCMYLSYTLEVYKVRERVRLHVARQDFNLHSVNIVGAFLVA